MKQSPAERFVAQALVTLLVAFGLWYLLKPEPRERFREPSPEEILESDQTPSTTAFGDESAPIPTGTPTDAPATSDQNQPQASLAKTPDTGTRLTQEQIVQRRSATKSALSSAYMSIVAFHAEYDRYTTDLAAAGYMPQEGVMPAKFGFLQPYEPRGGREENEVPSRHSSEIFLNLQDDEGQPIYSYDKHSKNVDLAKYARFCRDGCSASDTRFELIAAFNLDEDETLDVWIIDQNKEIRHVVDDEKE